MASVDKLLDALMKDYKNPEELIGENGLLKQLTIRWTPLSRQREGEFKIIAGRAAARRCPEFPLVSA
jgi:hypothetical protein